MPEKIFLKKKITEIRTQMIENPIGPKLLGFLSIKFQYRGATYFRNRSCDIFLILAPKYESIDLET